MAQGEAVEVRRRKEPVAVLWPAEAGRKVVLPDFAGRLRAVYGADSLETPATDLISEARGER